MRRAIEVLHDVVVGVFLASLALTWAAGAGTDAFAGEGGCCQADSAGCPSTGCSYSGVTCPYCNFCCVA